MNYFDASEIVASACCFSYKDKVKGFEKKFSHYLDIKYAIATSYGRTALYLGLRALNVNGGEVIIPSFICTVVRHAVHLAGAIPVFVDVSFDKLTYNIDTLKRSLSSKTKAIVLTHFFGTVAPNLEELIALGKESGIPVIEDCAHSLGAEHDGRKVGTFGDFSIFSLTKSTINYGGGVLATNNESLYLKARSIVDEEKFSLRSRIVDFPITLCYGFEQMIDKLLFDRVGFSIFKWWLIRIPRYLLYARSLILTLIKSPLSFFKSSGKQPVIHDGTKSSSDNVVGTYSYPLAMNRLTASLGISQLGKVDALINQRKHIFESIAGKLDCALKNYRNGVDKNANSFILFRFKNSNIFKIVERCKQQGLLLRPTWPTHQTLWNGQDTPSVREVERTILTWTVNPMLTEREIQRFIDIINSISESKES